MGADSHGVGERAIARLDEHPEAIDIRYDQIVPVVAIHVPRDVDMGDFASARRREAGRDPRS